MRKNCWRALRAAWPAVALFPLGLSSPVGAFIPPPIAVKVISADLETEARVAGLVELLVRYDNFQWSDNYVQRRRVLDCESESAPDQCIRNLIREAGAARGPLVVAVARRIDDNRVELRCVGSGKTEPKPDQQVVRLDLRATFFGETKTRDQLRRLALKCIWSAAAEDDSSIKRGGL